MMRHQHRRAARSTRRPGAICVALVVSLLLLAAAGQQGPDASAAQPDATPTPTPSPTATPLPGPTEDAITERTFWRLNLPSDRDAFTCEAPGNALQVNSLLVADFVCTSVRNPNAQSIPAVSVFDPDLVPAIVTVPSDRPYVHGNETVTVERELREEAAWLTWRQVAADPGAYRDALQRLVDFGVAQPGALNSPAWLDLDEFPLSEPDLEVRSVVLFDDQVNKWATLGINDYDLTFSATCYCPGNLDDVINVRVIDGQVVSATARDGSLPEFFADLTIDDMIRRLGDARTDPGAHRSSGALDVLYGIPRAWTIDPDAQVSDDEVFVSITSFTPLVDCQGTWVGIEPFDTEAIWSDPVETDIAFCAAQWQPRQLHGGNLTTYGDAFRLLVEVGIADPEAAELKHPLWADLFDPNHLPRLGFNFDKQQQKWQTLNIANYDLTFDIRCYCPNLEDVITVRVVDGQISEVGAADGELPQLFGDRTMDEIFATLLEAQTAPVAASLTGDIDLFYGIPLSFQLDPDATITDDELFFTLKTFDPLLDCDGTLRAFDPFAQQGFDVDAECGSPATQLGDVNCSGDVDVIDALFIVYYEVGYATGGTECPAAGELSIVLNAGDVDGDDQVGILDALTIAQCINEVPNPHCAALG